MLVKISKEVQFDSGHRVPTHKGKCKFPHGHRYRVIANCVGSIIDDPSRADHGMLVDFGDLKNAMNKLIHDRLDHKFIVWQDDGRMRTILGGFAIQGIEDWKEAYYLFPYIPTAENIACWSFQQLDPYLTELYGDDLRLESVQVWETPTSEATYYRPFAGPTTSGPEDG